MTGSHRDEGGQTIALFAVSLPLFLALLLLVIDGGRLLVEHERLRNATQFAAEAVASMAGDGGAPPTGAQAAAMASMALAKNMPDRRGGLAVDAPQPADGQPFKATVYAETVFTATIERIRFTIGARSAAQLGQSTGASGASAAAATPTPFAPSCYRVTAAHSRVPAYASQVSSSVITVTEPATGATAHDILYVRPAASVRWRVDTVLRGGGSHAAQGTVTLPANGAFSTTIDAGYSTVTLSARYGANAACPR